MLCISVMAAVCVLIYYAFHDYIFPRILEQKVDIKIEYFQLGSDITIKQLRNKFICEFSMLGVGKKLLLVIDIPKKIISPQEFVLGTLKIQSNRSYRVSFLEKKYQYQDDTFIYELEPVGIEHESLEHCLIDHNLKNSNKIRPKMYLVK